MAIIHAGIGTDIKKSLKEAKETQEETYFVDTTLSDFRSKEDEKTHIWCLNIEEFIINNLIKNPKVFINSTLKSSRMIEHIDINTLATLTFPLIKNLINVLDMKAELIYPDIDLILKFFNKMPQDDIFMHQLCNIEAIAFGEHKTILNERILKKHFDGVVEGFEPVILNNKPFYKKMSLKKQMKNVRACHGGVEKHFHSFDPNINNEISDEFWKLANSIDMSPSDSDILWFYNYIDLDKIENLAIKEVVQFIPFHKKRALYQDQIIRIITNEGLFELDSYRGCEAFNMIHPYENIITFKRA